jgi:membrane protein
LRLEVPWFVPAAWRLFLRALAGAYHDNALGYGKSAAYSALLAFFPLLATTATVLARVRADFVLSVIKKFLSGALPPGTEDLVSRYFVTSGKQPVLLPITGMLISIWAGSGVMVSLMQGFHLAYRVPGGRPPVRERVIAILLVFSAAIPALFASVMILAGNHVEHWAGGWLGLVPAGGDLRGWVSVLGGVARYIIALTAIVLGASILYRGGPNRPQRWSGVLPGAVVATILWLVATLGFGWYVRHLGNYNVLYGSLATVILLLVWMYVLAIVAYVGCEFNVEFEKAARARRSQNEINTGSSTRTGSGATAPRSC